MSDRMKCPRCKQYIVREDRTKPFVCSCGWSTVQKAKVSRGGKPLDRKAIAVENQQTTILREELS